MRTVTAKNQLSGFTLIEVVIAIAILLVVLQLVVGAYARFVRVERIGIHEQEMQEDIRLVLQLFNREARTGYGTTYQTNNLNPSASNARTRLYFRNQESDCVKYELIDNGPLDKGLFRSDTAGTGTDPLADCAGVTYNTARRLTDAKATIITKLEFVPRPAKLFRPDPVGPPDPLRLGEQGYIQIHLQVTSPPPSSGKPTILQSTVTSRQFIPYPI